MFKEVIESLLENVEKPSRYLGNEWNSIHKNKDEVLVRIALAFPDLYELGLGNLGLQILYSILNDLPYVWAERVYAPAPDLAKLLIERQIPLFLWESKDPVKSVDLLGFTLQSELTYTTVLNMLHLSQIPLLSKNREEGHPLVCAGGPCCANPEPMAPFVDFFVIGDGEEIAIEIAELLKALKGKEREEKLIEISKIEGVYVPKFVKTIQTSSGYTTPNPENFRVKRRISKKLKNPNYIKSYIVPFTQLIHEGLSIEIMRGCSRNCRFCLAGCIYRPVREHNPDEIVNLATKLLNSTGFESISLVSLATCDYSHINELLSKLQKLTKPRMTAINLPSLRVDGFSISLAEMVSGVRRSGLTFAPEAGSDRLRKVINKTVTNEELLEITKIAFSKGWTHIKLYFMIGLPTETDEDISALIELAILCLNEAKKIRNDAKIHLGISTFVPKPWTPFQWDQQISLEETKNKQIRILQELKKYKSIKVSFHSPEFSFIEGIISRADRKIGELIYRAWSKGAYLETSSNQINFDHWLSALRELNIQPDGLLGKRKTDEPLPWDFIDIGIKKEWLLKQREIALKELTTPDCREGKCDKCGIQLYTKEQCLRWNKKIDYSEELAKHISLNYSPEPVQRLLFKIKKIKMARFLSHLELYNAWIRILRRANLPLAYSKGFHAHPKISFAYPAPVGEILLEEFIDLWLAEESIPYESYKEKVKKELPDGFVLDDIGLIPKDSPSIMQRVKGAEYCLLIETKEGKFEQVSEHAKKIFITMWEHYYPKEKSLTPLYRTYKILQEETESSKGKIYLSLQWISPLVENRMLKSSQLRKELQLVIPSLKIYSIRIHTFLDHISESLSPELKDIHYTL
ncbi:MAG: TIGR03960 family B12-binding radical SAM protein [Candidatus Hydrogenedentes bacterium]|nr:TIGR03960 family B12-binding radical SAM protein [Candidatus Hydrogenedentota bacterium]